MTEARRRVGKGERRFVETAVSCGIDEGKARGMWHAKEYARAGKRLEMMYLDKQRFLREGCLLRVERFAPSFTGPLTGRPERDLVVKGTCGRECLLRAWMLRSNVGPSFDLEREDAAVPDGYFRVRMVSLGERARNANGRRIGKPTEEGYSRTMVWADALPGIPQPSEIVACRRRCQPCR